MADLNQNNDASSTISRQAVPRTALLADIEAISLDTANTGKELMYPALRDQLDAGKHHMLVCYLRHR